MATRAAALCAFTLLLSGCSNPATSPTVDEYLGRFDTSAAFTALSQQDNLVAAMCNGPTVSTECRTALLRENALVSPIIRSVNSDTLSAAEVDKVSALRHDAPLLIQTNDAALATNSTANLDVTPDDSGYGSTGAGLKVTSELVNLGSSQRRINYVLVLSLAAFALGAIGVIVLLLGASFSSKASAEAGDAAEPGEAASDEPVVAATVEEATLAALVALTKMLAEGSEYLRQQKIVKPSKWTQTVQLLTVVFVFVSAVLALLSHV